MRRLTLRARLALLVAATVAVAVAGCALSGYFLVRGQLYRQLDATLQSPQGPGMNGGQGQRPPRGLGGPDDFLNLILTNCSSEPTSDMHGPPHRTTQLVKADGSRCVAPNSYALVVTAADIAVANGESRSVIHDGKTTSGQDVRIYTQQDPLHTGVAVSYAEPLDTTQDTLNRLALLLLAVGGIGIIVAASAGLLIARAGLKPVDRLTDTVEHIARTEDLDTPIPVKGKDEIARLAESFNAMTSALASARDHQRRLIADAGHELRTPLTSLRTNIDLLMRSEATGRPLPPETRERLLISVKAQLQELSSLVIDLLELSRPDQKQNQAEIVALHDVVGHAVERARLRGPGLRIVGQVDEWFVHAEPGSLQRAVVNLLDNAVKFSPPGGIVEVRLQKGDLTVRDHGPGIPEEDLPHVFERFWRSPTARSLPGSGLGLSIVARVAEESGGRVTLENAPDGGTIARLSLPGSPGD